MSRPKDVIIGRWYNIIDDAVYTITASGDYADTFKPAKLAKLIIPGRETQMSIDSRKYAQLSIEAKIELLHLIGNRGGLGDDVGELFETLVELVTRGEDLPDKEEEEAFPPEGSLAREEKKR